MSLLYGITALDLTDGLAGEFAGQVLVDHGATIVRVDRPGAVREQRHLVRLRGRRSIVVDDTTLEGCALMDRLAAQVDLLLVEPDLTPRAYDAGYERLAALNPRLIVCRVSGQGDAGPRAGQPQHDHLVAARHGVYSQKGWRDGPSFVTAPVPSLGAALLLVQGIGSALLVRERTGRGQEVTTSLLAGALAYHPGILWALGAPPSPNPISLGRSPLGGPPFYRLYECADGEWLQLGCLSVPFQRRAIEVLALDAAMEALGFGTPRAVETNDEMAAVVQARMRERTSADWAALFEQQDVPYAPARWTEDLLDDPQVQATGMAAPLHTPAGDGLQLAAAVTVDGAAFDPPEPGPEPGKHTDDVLAEAGLAAGEVARLRAAGVVA